MQRNSADYGAVLLLRQASAACLFDFFSRVAYNLASQKPEMFLTGKFVEEGRPRQVVWIDGEYTDLVNMSILRDEWRTLDVERRERYGLQS